VALTRRWAFLRVENAWHCGLNPKNGWSLSRKYLPLWLKPVIMALTRRWTSLQVENAEYLPLPGPLLLALALSLDIISSYFCNKCYHPIDNIWPTTLYFLYLPFLLYRT